jgi:16S rRNA (adenine1518-N6/adenine1519-N6)-dimethyltransferase
VKRSLGQNFLVDPKVAARIVRGLGIEPGDAVLEIGPGGGALTVHLVAAGAVLVLLEKDSELVPVLAGKYANHPNVRVVEGDATVVDLAAIAPGGRPLRVIGNLPYNAGSPILFRALALCPARAVFMLQREVAHRLACEPGDREFGAVSVLVQARARVRALFDVSPDRFRPRPRVWSTVLALEPISPQPEVAAAIADPGFPAFVHGLHAQPRQTAANSLSHGLRIPKARALAAFVAAGQDPGRRPCTFGPGEVVRLWECASLLAL